METCKYGSGASTRKPPTARWVWRWVLSPQISHLPKNHNKNWFALSYNVMSAPEFWVFGESDAQIMDGNIYVFSIHGAKSNNGTEFSKRLTNVTLLMDFGETGGEGVDVEWIRSVADLEF